MAAAVVAERESTTKVVWIDEQRVLVKDDRVLGESGTLADLKEEAVKQALSAIVQNNETQSFTFKSGDEEKTVEVTGKSDSKKDDSKKDDSKKDDSKDSSGTTAPSAGSSAKGVKDLKEGLRLGAIRQSITEAQIKRDLAGSEKNDCGNRISAIESEITTLKRENDDIKDNIAGAKKSRSEASDTSAVDRKIAQQQLTIELNKQTIKMLEAEARALKPVLAEAEKEHKKFKELFEQLTHQRTKMTQKIQKLKWNAAARANDIDAEFNSVVTMFVDARNGNKIAAENLRSSVKIATNKLGKMIGKLPQSEDSNGEFRHAVMGVIKKSKVMSRVLAVIKTSHPRAVIPGSSPVQKDIELLYPDFFRDNNIGASIFREFEAAMSARLQDLRASQANATEQDAYRIVSALVLNI